MESHGRGKSSERALHSPVYDTAVWLKDNRRVMVVSNGRLYLVDSESGKSHLIYEKPGLFWLNLSSDNRWIYLAESRDEAEIWMATSK